MVKSLGTAATSPKLAGTLERQGTGRRGVSVVQILKKRQNKGRICKQNKADKEGKNASDRTRFWGQEDNPNFSFSEFARVLIGEIKQATVGGHMILETTRYFAVDIFYSPSS